MMNQVVIIGKLETVFNADDEWIVGIRVEDEVFYAKVWEGLADVLTKKQQGEMIALKGKLGHVGDATTIIAERVSIMSAEKE